MKNKNNYKFYIKSYYNFLDYFIFDNKLNKKNIIIYFHIIIKHHNQFYFFTK